MRWHNDGSSHIDNDIDERSSLVPIETFQPSSSSTVSVTSSADPHLASTPTPMPTRNLQHQLDVHHVTSSSSSSSSSSPTMASLIFHSSPVKPSSSLCQTVLVRLMIGVLLVVATILLTLFYYETMSQYGNNRTALSDVLHQSSDLHITNTTNIIDRCNCTTNINTLCNTWCSLAFGDPRSLSCQHDTTSRHGIAKVSSRKRKMETNRPLIPGRRVYDEGSSWDILPDLSTLQNSAYVLESSSLPSLLLSTRMDDTDSKNKREAYRIKRLRECLDIWLTDGNWTKTNDVLSWQWSAAALQRCPFQILSHDDIKPMYTDKSIVVTGDSMSRELFYGVSAALSSIQPNHSIKVDQHWSSDDGRTTMDLWRANFAMLLAHAVDIIYYTRIIQPLNISEYNDVANVAKASIDQICNQPENARRWFNCNMSIAAADTAMFVGGAAAWEPRAFVGLYGYYSNERDWERYKLEEYAVHVERYLSRVCSMSSSMVIWRTCNKIVNTKAKVRKRDDGDVTSDKNRELDEVAVAIINKLRHSHRCHNLFVLNARAVTARRSELTQDGYHYPDLIPLVGQLAHNAYRLWINQSFPDYK